MPLDHALGRAPDAVRLERRRPCGRRRSCPPCASALRAAASSSRDHDDALLRDARSSPKSRPSSSQRRRSASTLRGQLPLEDGHVVPDVGVARGDAHQHASRRRRRSGSAGGSRASARRPRPSTRKCLPSKVARSSVQRRFSDLERLVERAQPLARRREGTARSLELGREPARAETDDGTRPVRSGRSSRSAWRARPGCGRTAA